MARMIDADRAIEWFKPYLHTGEPIPADVVIEDLRSMPTLTPPNEPLTLEELREMEGKPFWDCASREWDIVAYVVGSRLYTETGTYVDFAEEETEQRFYRRPPEGEEETP